MKKVFVCGVTCFPGGKNCNNYCNHDHKKNMPDSPGIYEEEDLDKKFQDLTAKIKSKLPEPTTPEELAKQIIDNPSIWGMYSIADAIHKMLAKKEVLNLRGELIAYTNFFMDEGNNKEIQEKYVDEYLNQKS